MQQRDFGERLYSHRTTASRTKTNNGRAYQGGNYQLPSGVLQQMARQHDMDVKDEVDRMYRSIMQSIDEEIHPTASHDVSMSSYDAADRLAKKRPGSATSVPLRASTDELRLQAQMTTTTTTSGGSRPSSAALSSTHVDYRPYIKQLPLHLLGHEKTTFGSARRTALEPSKKKIDEPGPGDYYASTTGSTSSTPRWSFGKTAPRRDPTPESRKQKVNDMPGPGDYKVPSTFETPRSGRKGTFSQADLKRSSLEKSGSEMPGPGSYDLSERRSTRSPSPGKVGFHTSSPRMPLEKKQQPGVGEYFKEESKDKVGYSIPKAKREAKQEETPGPGSYALGTNIPQHVRKSRGVIPATGRDDEVFGGKKLREHSPGPGTYTPALEEGRAVKIPAPSTTQPRVTKLPTPGPGQYYPQLATNDGPQWSMYGKYPDPADNAKETGPGPAQYFYGDVGLDITNAPKYSFSIAPREKRSPTDDTPGPGYYNVAEATKEEGFVHKIGGEKRETLPGLKREDGPGPADYYPEEPKSAVIGPTFGTSKKEEPNPQSEFPGPGYYSNMAQSTLAPQSAVFGTADRPTSFMPSDQELHVGPGAYENNVNFNSGIAYTMGTRHEASDNTNKDEVPGPGAYEAQAGLNAGGSKAPTVGTAPRFEKEVILETPGPGAYDVNGCIEGVEGASPKAFFGTAKKEQKADENVNVGPGAYDPQLPQQLVGGDIGRAQRFEELKPNGVPGPGAYNEEALDKGPSIAFTTASGHPTEKQQEEVPGPGAYFVNTDGTVTQAPSIGFGTAPARVDPAGVDVPGPGAYDPQLISPHTPAATFTTVVHSNGQNGKENNTNLGPGSYFPNDPSDGPSAFFGTASRVEKAATDDTPAPGYYNTETTAVEERAPQVAFTKGQRFVKQDQDDFPGPGFYEATKDSLTRPSAPMVAFGTGDKNKVEPSTEVPGPGAYDAVIQQTVPSITIHGVERQLHQLRPSDGPGPGSYQPYVDSTSQQYVNAHSFGTAARPVSLATTDPAVPGPGAYYIVTQPDGQQFSFPCAPRATNEIVKTTSPGPGAYMVKSTPSGPFISFNTAPRQDPQQKQSEMMPGPGQYNIQDDFTVEQAHSGAITFPKARPLPPPNMDIPGPGTYFVMESSNGSPVISFPVASREAMKTSDQQGPGPGAYNPKDPNSWTTEAISFGTAVRPDMSSKNEVPGPGAYRDTYQPKNPVVVAFSHDPGHNVKTLTADVPGPGHYNPLDPSNEGPSIAFPHQLRFQDSSTVGDNPGPGAYTVISNQGSGPSITFTQAPRNPPDVHEDMPGPGEYAVSLKPEGPFYSIGQASTVIQTGSDAPGPGAYYIPSQKSEQGITIPKTGHYSIQNEGSDAPGPGAYDFSKNENKGPSITFAQSKRPWEMELTHRADEPGPGAYNPANYATGPSATLVGKPNDPPTTQQENPGPGAYDVKMENEAPSIGFSFRPISEISSIAKVDSEPGPGSYLLASTLGTKGITIPKSGRPSEAERNKDLPGPGHYDAEFGTDMFDGPKYSFPKAGVSEGGNVVLVSQPGPGEYWLDDGNHAPAFSFPKAIRVGEKPQTFVGPGEYELPDPDRGPVITIPKAPVTTTSTKSMVQGPGPGEYYVPQKLDPRRGVSMAGKWQESHEKENFPGPGQYFIQDFDPYEKDKAMVYDFGKARPQQLMVISSGPGPGQYYRPPSAGKGVTILNRFPPQYEEFTPGPPDYHPQIPLPAFAKPVTSD